MATAYPEEEENDPFGLGQENKQEDPDDFEDTPLLGRQPPTPDKVLETSTTKGARRKSGYVRLPREEIEMEAMEENKDEVWTKIVDKFPNAKHKFLFEYDEWDRIVVKISGRDPDRNVWHLLFDENGDVNKGLPKTITKDLGPSAEEIVEANDGEITKRKGFVSKLKETVRFHREKALKTPEEVSQIESIEGQIVEQEQEIANLEVENEQIQERMSLRDRVKAIFKKYGFTVFAVVSAVGVVIGVIVSNLSKGLSRLGKGVGDGLKNIGKKLGELLPGMVGAIVSFLFKTAGEVISFLGKNAWLLILAVVVYFVDELKKRRR